MDAKLSLFVAAMTEAGGRSVNEDSYLTLYGDQAPCQTLGLLAVADGMGGSGNGHTASVMTTETLADTFAAACEVSQGKPVATTRDLLRFAVQKANAAVYQASQKVKENRGMGSACVAAAIANDNIHIARVGDSRAYLFRNSQLQRLMDDEWTKSGRQASNEEEEVVANRRGVTVVNRAIGWQPVLSPDVTSVALMTGDIVLLCSDGLTDELTEEEIERMLQKGSDISETCNWLVKSACSTEECDNVTVIIAKFSSTSQQTA